MDGITLQTEDVCVCRAGKLIVNSVSFRAEPGQLTAIIGPNGAGKTTLMRTLTGERPDSGRVLIAEEDMYENPEYWLRKIGYVPVDNVLHEYLTLWKALIYAGRLRRPDLTLCECEARVDELLKEFDFPANDARRHKQIRRLSTGERKRANICSELLLDPPILLLDEPTSGLDPDAEWSLMERLALYAHKSKRTILIITHTLNTLNFCDKVIFIANSRKEVSGTSTEVLSTLEGQNAGALSIAEAAQEKGDLSTNPHPSVFSRWARVFSKYKTDEEKREDCDAIKQSGGSMGASIKNARITSSISHRVNSAPWFYQLRYLLSRYIQVRLGDKWGLTGTILAGFISGVLLFTLPSRAFVKPFDPSEIGVALTQARQSIYVVALVVTLIGLITSYTEISKEFRIYRHERLKGLSPSAYFMSKWIWLATVVGILAPIVLVGFIVLVYQQPLPGFNQPRPEFGEIVNWWEVLFRYQMVGLFTKEVSWLILITLVFACIASVTLGLLLSALAGDSGRGYLYLSFVVVFIVLFSGLIRNERLENVINLFSFASTGKWAYEGVASSIGIYCWSQGWQFDEFNSIGHITSVWLSLIIYILVAALLTVVALRIRDPWYRRWVNLSQFLSRDWTQIAVYLSILIFLLSFAIFLRQNSFEYHLLTYFSEPSYGGTGAVEYAKIENLNNISLLQFWNGKISQALCSN